MKGERGLIGKKKRGCHAEKPAARAQHGTLVSTLSFLRFHSSVRRDLTQSDLERAMWRIFINGRMVEGTPLRTKLPNRDFSLSLASRRGDPVSLQFPAAVSEFISSRLISRPATFRETAPRFIFSQVGRAGRLSDFGNSDVMETQACV